MLRRRKLTLEQLLTNKTGPDVTPYDMERISRGTVSDVTIRREIERGNLKPLRYETRGRVTVTWIAFAEARSYFERRGFTLAA